MQRPRKPLFLLALVALVLCVLVEAGAPLLLPREAPERATLEATVRSEGAEGDVDMDEVLETQRDNPPTPGLGIPSLALVDGLLLLTLGWVGASLRPGRVHGRGRGLVTLPITLLTLSASLAMLFATFGRLTSMMSLFCSVPFGTIAYVAVWGGFNREGAALTLGLLLLLKLAAGTCLVLAHPRFLRSRGLVRLVLTSLLATVLITFLHGLVPRLLVSITDVLGALLVAVLGLVWALVLLVDALVSLLRGPRLERG